MPYMTYEDASQLNIPTIDQWNELVQICQWSVYYLWSETTFKMITCIGPNGKYNKFQPLMDILKLKMIFVYQQTWPYFWFTNNEGGISPYKKAVVYDVT